MLKAAFAGALLALVAAPAAVACSCFPQPDARTALRRADGGFVGVYLGRRPLGTPRVRTGADPFVYVFRVERVLKGKIGRRVEVVSARQADACGLDVTRGERWGIVLGRRSGRWWSTLCSQYRPAAFGRRALARCG